MDNKRLYVTAAIPYVNAPPHLGHALEFVQADVVARSHRALGEDVFFISGADENSLKNVQAAEREGMSVQALCDRNAAAFVELARLLNVSFDRFHRSSDPEHMRSSQDLWRRCAANGDIYKKSYRGLYCVGCEAFYTSDELTETGECFEHPGKKLDEIEEENYFFRLSKYADALEELINVGRYRIIPEGRKKEALQFIRKGLEDFSISRSKARSHGWGVPVPDDPDQIMYVWFDALNVYRSAAPDRWPADLHMIGKGILRFHAVYWPAILLSAQEPLPKELFVHGYITVEGKKMSKTTGNVIDPTKLIARYGTDAVRYYLLREIPSCEDGDYGEKKFIARYNADLANGLGNFAARVLSLGSMFQKHFSDYHIHSADITSEIFNRIEETKPIVVDELKKFNFQKALAAVFNLVSFGDGYLNVVSPWRADDVHVRDLKMLSKEVFSLVMLLDTVAELLHCFLPDSTRKIKESIQQDGTFTIKKIPPLFPRIL